MATQPDFWGDIGRTGIKPPVAILREQAALLGSKTRNLVEARVETTAALTDFSHAFSLVVPTLSYQYQLFTIRHGVEMYPLLAGPPQQELKDEEAFQQWLQAKLSSAETKKIIESLLSQVAA